MPVGIVKYSELVSNAARIGYFRLSDAMVRRAVCEGRELTAGNIIVTVPAPGHTNKTYMIGVTDEHGTDAIAWGMIGQTPAQVDFCCATGEKLDNIIRTLQAVGVFTGLLGPERVYLGEVEVIVTLKRGWMTNTRCPQTLTLD